jgi:acyl-CoA synthetase (NDP forming)
VLSTFLGFEGVPGALSARGASSPAPGSVPSYASPERAVRALGRAVRYAAWRNRPSGTVPELPGMDLDAARALVEEIFRSTPAGRALTPEEAGGLLGAMNLVLSDEVPPESVEVVIGARDDPSFGALASFGIAGVAIELLGDRAYAPIPLTTADADELVRAPRAAPLLTGYAGVPAMDLLALSELALRLSVLADVLPELAECTMHVLAAPIGAQVASVTARVAPAAARADTGPRRLRGQ